MSTQPQQRPLSTKLALGTASATLVSVPLALGVTVFDRSVIQYANGSAPSLRQALFSGFRQLLTSPLTCLRGKDSLAVLAVYSSTYVTKNSAELVSKDRGMDPFWPVFWASTIVNSGGSVVKDRFLATMFGQGKATNFPMNSYFGFLARDGFVIMASFNGPRYATTVSCVNEVALLRCCSNSYSLIHMRFHFSLPCTAVTRSSRPQICSAMAAA
jgi:hypothetical protein